MKPVNLNRYEPWALFNDFLAATGPVAASERKFAWLPSVDVHEEAGRFVVRADLPGVEQRDIEITADNGVLTLRGVRRFEGRGEAKFLRHFTLPEDAQAAEIKAKHSNGVLEISIPKQPKLEPKRITVEAA